MGVEGGPGPLLGASSLGLKIAPKMAPPPPKPPPPAGSDKAVGYPPEGRDQRTHPPPPPPGGPTTKKSLGGPLGGGGGSLGGGRGKFAQKACQAQGHLIAPNMRTKIEGWDSFGGQG